MPVTPRPRPVALRIELRDVAPLVWRRVLVSNQWTLASLHHYLQWIMGWRDTHAHEFQVGEGMVAPDWWIREIGNDTDARHCRDERRASVAAVVSELGVRGEFDYRYDMGDDWCLRMVIEQLPAGLMDGLPLPMCVAGENAGPPDDVGGPHMYGEFLSAIGDRNHAHTMTCCDGSAVFSIRKALISIVSIAIGRAQRGGGGEMGDQHRRRKALQYDREHQAAILRTYEFLHELHKIGSSSAIGK